MPKRTIIQSILVIGAITSMLTVPAFAEPTTESVKKIGAWTVSSASGTSSGKRYPIVRVEQSISGALGAEDWIDSNWMSIDHAIQLSTSISKCDKDGQGFQEILSLNDKEWMAIGAKGMSKHFQSTVKGWLAKASSQCSARKVGTIFKMARVDVAMKDFMNRIQTLSASQKTGT
jgi:hypothetical protein